MFNKKNKKFDKKENNSTVFGTDKNTLDTSENEEDLVISSISKKPLIEISNVQKNFSVGKNVIHVLKDINLKIYQGEFIVILGPSGSGKSTMLNTLLGLEPPTIGKVIVDGVDLTQMTENQIAQYRYKKYGIVFQRAEWIRSINVMQNVALSLAINGINKKEREKIAIEMLTKVGMEAFAKYTPSELSGGQQQKVTLARALTNDANIIVADEPTGNLDSNSAEKVMNIFKALNEEQHKTLIMITHNIDYVRYASRTVYIKDGKIVEGSAQFLSE